MSFMTVLSLFWIGFCSVALIILLKKRKYYKITYSKLKNINLATSPIKFVEIVGTVKNILSVQPPSTPDIYLTKSGTTMKNLILNDGTGNFKVLYTETFKEWIQKGDKLKIRGQFSSDFSINPYEIYNITSGKHKGKEFNLSIGIIGIIIGIVALYFTGFNITLFDIILFTVFMIGMIIFAIGWYKNIAKPKLGL